MKKIKKMKLFKFSIKTIHLQVVWKKKKHRKLAKLSNLLTTQEKHDHLKCKVCNTGIELAFSYSVIYTKSLSDFPRLKHLHSVLPL